MKKLAFVVIMGLSLTNSVYAKDSDVVEKIMQCNTTLTNGSLIFNAQKSGDGYDIKITPENKTYSVIFNKDAKIHISVDEGPLITTPSFAFGKAGLKASGDALAIFSKELLSNVDKSLKKHPKYSYEGKVSFGGELSSKTIIDGITINNGETELKTSNFTINNSMDIDSCIGKMDISIPNVDIEDKKAKANFKAKGVELISEITDKPVDGIALFGATNIKVKELSFKDRVGQKAVDAKFSLDIDTVSQKVNDKYMNVAFKLKSEALNTNTIALAQGIKKTELDIELKNSQIDGILDLVKLSKELEKVQDDLEQARIKNDDIALQKALLKMNELTSVNTVAIYNKVMIKDKTRLKLDFSLEGEKRNFAKVDLLYKASPISGNIQSAMIELAAQNIAVADGTFEVQLDSTMATAVNPFAMLALDMLKAKGFATVKNGVYHLKGELKGGKIVINGKAYTLQELSRALF